MALFRLLSRYRYLPANFLHAFLGGHATYHRERLTALFHEGWLAKPTAQWEAYDARYRPNVYELGKRARHVVTEREGSKRFAVGSGGHFRHELMVCQVVASIELAARAADVSFIDWPAVLSGAPAATQAADAPFSIPMIIAELRGRRLLRADGLPFCLHFGRRTFCFLGVEADRHTEPLSPTDLNARTSSIAQKILQYRHFVRERLFERHLGMPNFLLPIITVNETHMRNMMDLALRLSDGAGFKWLLFQCRPALGTTGLGATPEHQLLTAPWERAGNPPLCILDEIRAHA